MKPNHSLTVVALSVSLLGAGCGSEQPAVEATTGGEQPGTNARGVTPPSVQRNVVLTPANASGEDRCSLRTVFFAFDSAELDAPSREEIEAAVECFRTRGAPARLHLTGATDPRGTEEYNLALGERRADSVRRYLTSLGIDGARIAVNSVGEEMSEGDDEDGFARDRNVSSFGED